MSTEQTQPTNTELLATPAPSTIQTGEGSASGTETAKDGGTQSNDASKDEADIGKRLRGVEKRISKLTAKNRQSESDLAHERARSAAFEVELAKFKGSQPAQNAQPAATQSKEIDPDKFAKPEDYWKAVGAQAGREEAKKLLDEERAAARQNEAKVQGERQASTFQQRIEAAKQVHSDFEEVVEAEVVNWSPAMRELIKESENGATTLYQLMKDPKERDRINALSPLQAARAFESFEVKFAKPATTIDQKVSKAPPPATHSSGAGAGTVKKTIYDKDLPFSEYKKLRTERPRSA